MSSPSTTIDYPRHIPSIPYSSPQSRLQTLDLWFLQPPENFEPATSFDPVWLVYIHGGAWRDPTQDAFSCFEPARTHLFESYPTALNNIAGIASLNYRLSPYVDHATDPSQEGDTERSAQHPQHIRDVEKGIRFLAREYGMRRWIGVGHSCGATILLQMVSGIGLYTSPSPGPEALILLEGIYNIPLLLRNHLPPACPPHISDIYKSFIAGAFGHDISSYLPASPVAGKYSKEQWPEGRLMVLCHSHSDELVERQQRDVVCVALDREGWSIVMEVGDEEDEVRAEGRRVLNVRDLKGGHDWIWEDGEQIAKLIVEVVERLT
jgi:kynurenine formamidase